MNDSPTIDVRKLRIGLHVHLDLGWMAHPFPLSSFRISTEQQLETLRGLGLDRVRISPQRSDALTLQGLVGEGLLSPEVAGVAASEPAAPEAAPEPAVPAETPEAAERRRRREALQAEQACAAQAERHYSEAGRALRRSFELAASQPQAAREQCEAQVNGFLDTVLGAQEMAIRLLSEGAGDRGSMHAINVTVIALLLGKQMGLGKPEMFDLGTGAMLHDIGKIELPERVRWIDPLSPGVSNHERQFYQEHVAHGVALGRKMALAPGALLVLAQHHEHADSTGFPLKLGADKMNTAAKIVALVNRYDNLCNPATPAQALTPHEALALMYGQMKAKFDTAVFGAFVKMMGVYPPGSVVQLTDDRYGMVVSVNSARPLKPCVLVHEPRQPRNEAVPLNLETTPSLGIRRSLKPQHLPRATLDYLSPRPRVCYFFERAREPFLLSAGSAA
ncbi:HD-GYP domain-containing protein [Methylibium sp.]|uniref:HD-GYP domain-containing protein n=1 Tax=Methylibium sp. TaxID=2067992 RepID=UPI003D102AA6